MLPPQKSRRANSRLDFQRVSDWPRSVRQIDKRSAVDSLDTATLTFQIHDCDIIRCSASASGFWRHSSLGEELAAAILGLPFLQSSFSN